MRVDRGFYRAKHPGLSKEEENEVFTQSIADLIVGLKAQCDAGSPTVLVSHYTITGCNMESGQTAFFSQFEPVVYPDTLQAADFDLVCFGHIHRPQQLDGCKNTFYCGAISALNFNDEGQERGYWLHDVEDDGTVHSTFQQLPTRQYKTIRLKDEDVAEIINADRAEDKFPFPVPDVKGDIVRVLYDCTDEHNKAFNHTVYEAALYNVGGAFWVQEITPQKISITVDKKSMDADGTPESNLAEYLAEKEFTPERLGEIIELARPIIAEATEKATTERHTGLFVPVEIEVKNYRNYREETFSFEDIRFCTINGSNGVGKSSLFMDAMADALFEETREGELTGWICNDPDARSGAIKFTFKLGESLYRVTRTRQKSGKATLNISEFVEGEWVDRSKEKFKDTQQEIINIIGMDSLTLKACALIMQDQYGLKLMQERSEELAKAQASAEETATKGKAELEKVTAELEAVEVANSEYEKLQQEILTARTWLDKEKQLPVARQQKEAASLRVFELSGEIEELEKELEETRTELAEEQSKTVGTAELRAQVEAAEAEIKAMQDAAQAATLKLGGLKKQAEELAKKLKQAAELQNSVNVLGGKAAGYEELKKAFSQDGIPHNIIRSIIPVFEATATNILGQMSQGRMSVEFVTEKVLKSNSKKEVTTLDIIINDVDTGRLPYMSRSGGERVKAALSVILALSEIKSSKAGVQLGFLFIDEPPFLDAPGVQAYCDALEAIQNRYSNLKVMAITHDPAMKSRFPQSVDVVKTAEGSKVIYE